MCSGLAFKVRESDRDEVIAYLRARELVTNVYSETLLPAQLHDPSGAGRVVSCVTYVVDPYHEQYAGTLDLDALVAIIARAEGQSGKNDAYFLDTTRQLRDIGIEDEMMEAIAREAADAMSARPVTGG